MRLAFINPVREFGGGERWLVNLGAALGRAGHEITVLCRPTATWQAAAAGAGLAVVRVPMVHDLSLASIARLAHALRRARPEAVICCNQRGLRLGTLAARLAGGPPVVFRNGLAGSFKDHPFNRWISARVSRFVVNAYSLSEELGAFGWIPAERLSVIYNGVDTRFYSPTRTPGAEREVRRRWGVPDGSLVVAAAGRLVADKGHADLVRAATLLRHRHPRLRVVILGEGSEAPRLREQAAAAGLDGIILLPGFEPDMPAALAAADVICHPSHREGLPNVLLEAMASALPAVATDVDGTPEIVRHGATGFLVSPGDSLALADHLDTLLSQPALRADFGRRARQLVEDHFSLPASRRRWEELLAGVVAERRAAESSPQRTQRTRRRRNAKWSMDN